MVSASGNAVMALLDLTISLTKRELRNRFNGTLSGGLWALLQPLLQLAIYSFVFVRIFNARVPETSSVDYVPYLAVALWWTAFSEAVVRASTVIQENAALIGKVAMPRQALVWASVCSSFLVHLIGFAVIIVLLWLMGKGIEASGILPSLLLYIPLFALAAGFAFLCAAMQVFVRDLAPLLTQIMPLLMFTAPIFYGSRQWPPNVQFLLHLNPYTGYAETFRALLLDIGMVDASRLLVMLAVAAAVLLLGLSVFRRLIRISRISFERCLGSAE
jgi:ABC-type polysaccharide/polyol phosphate export permease